MVKQINAFIIVGLLLISIGVGAQNPEDLKLSDNFLIKNVQIKQTPDRPLFRGDILIQNGIITQVGSSVNEPKDVIIIDGDSLYAYPGFIASYTHAGIPKAKDKKLKDVDDPDNPGYKRAGITPQNSISKSVDLNDKTIESYRKSGFTTAHIAPKSGMLSGQGSIYNLDPSAENPIIKKDYSQNGSFQSAKGRVYPSTVIAVIAKYKNLFNQAAIDYEYKNKYQQSPSGMVRPSIVPEIEALFPIINGDQAFYFQSRKTLDISRALKLKENISSIKNTGDVNMIICDVKQAFNHIDALKNQNITVLTSMKLPDTIKIEKKDSIQLENEKYSSLVERKKESIRAYRNQCNTLQENGVQYNFSFGDLSIEDIEKSLKIIAESGISKETILSKLTKESAELLGISNITGTLEKGKLANIVLSTKPFMEDGSFVRHTIIEGKVYEYEEKKKEKSKSESLEGKWSMEADIDGSTESAMLSLSKQEDAWEGSLLYDDETLETKQLEIKDKTLSFSFDLPIENIGTVEAKISAKVDKNEITSGELTIPGMGKFPVTFTKKPNQ